MKKNDPDKVPPLKPGKDIPLKPDTDPDPTRKKGDDPEKSDPSRKEDPSKVDPSRIKEPIPDKPIKPAI